MGERNVQEVALVELVQLLDRDLVVGRGDVGGSRKSYFKNRLGGLGQYYRGTLQALEILGVTEQGTPG